jgi:hypothetical protein
MTSDTSVDTVRAACNHLRDGHTDAALAVLGEPDPSDTVSQSLALCARGLNFERQGLADDAAACFEQVYGMGIPLPVLLHQGGKYYKRTRRFERAYECYSLLWHARPDLIREFLADLPAEKLTRYSPWIIASQLGFYALQPLKAALARDLGPPHAALAFAQLAGYEPGFRVASVRIRSLRDFARRHASSYEELTLSKQMFLPAPPLFRRDLPPGVPSTTRTMFFCALDDVIVSSESSFILHDNQALLDAEQGERKRIILDLDVDPLVFGPAGDTATALIAQRGLTGPPLERAFPLTGVSTKNFGHWLLEYLPKVFACLDRPGFASVPIIIDSHMPRQHREALELFVGKDHPIVTLEPHDAVAVKRLWMCSALAYLPLGPRPGRDPGDDIVTPADALTVDAEALVALYARARPALSTIQRTTGPERIYLARKDRQHRRMVNRPEVEAWFASQGFAILDFGELTFHEQLALVRNADLIVGPDGSSNFITFFARPGTRVGILSNAFAEDNEWLALVCRALGQPMLILTGEIVRKNTDYRQFSSYRIDVEMLPAYIDELLSMS